MTPSWNSANDDSYAGTTSETTRKNVTETLRLMPLQAEWREVLSHLGFRVQDIRRLDGEKKYRWEVLLKPVNPFISTSWLWHFERGYSIPEIIELAKKTGNTFELLEKALEFAFREIQGDPSLKLSANAFLEDFLEKDGSGKNRLLTFLQGLKNEFARENLKCENLYIELLEEPYSEELRSLFFWSQDTNSGGENEEQMSEIIRKLWDVIQGIQNLWYKVSLDDIDRKRDGNLTLIILLKLQILGILLDELKINGGCMSKWIEIGKKITPETDLGEEIAGWKEEWNTSYLESLHILQLAMIYATLHDTPVVVEYVENKQVLSDLIHAIHVIYMIQWEQYRKLTKKVPLLDVWDRIIRNFRIQWYISDEDMRDYTESERFLGYRI